MQYKVVSRELGGLSLKRIAHTGILDNGMGQCKSGLWHWVAAAMSEQGYLSWGRWIAMPSWWAAETSAPRSGSLGGSLAAVLYIRSEITDGQLNCLTTA